MTGSIFCRVSSIIICPGLTLSVLCFLVISLFHYSQKIRIEKFFMHITVSVVCISGLFQSKVVCHKTVKLSAVNSLQEWLEHPGIGRSQLLVRNFGEKHFSSRP